MFAGFAVPYFQVPWAEKHGALQTFGCEAAIVAGLFLLVVPYTQLKGRSLRVSIVCTKSEGSSTDNVHRNGSHCIETRWWDRHSIEEPKVRSAVVYS